MAIAKGTETPPAGPDRDENARHDRAAVQLEIDLAARRCLQHRCLGSGAMLNPAEHFARHDGAYLDY